MSKKTVDHEPTWSGVVFLKSCSCVEEKPGSLSYMVGGRFFNLSRSSLANNPGSLTYMVEGRFYYKVGQVLKKTLYR